MVLVLEYGIFHVIFLEYSKKCKTIRGDVKYNQDKLWEHRIENSKIIGKQSKWLKYWNMEYSMEYSIFQNFYNFDCLSIFLNIPVIFHILNISIFPLLKVFVEYSWNIPYSKYFNISLLKVYFGIFHFWDFHIPWNIP